MLVLELVGRGSHRLALLLVGFLVGLGVGSLIGLLLVSRSQ